LTLPVQYETTMLIVFDKGIDDHLHPRKICIDKTVVVRRVGVGRQGTICAR